MMTEKSRADPSMISLGNEREVLDLVANSIMGLWDVVNDLTRLRPTQRERYRVTIFWFGPDTRGPLGLCGRARRCRRTDTAQMRYCDRWRPGFDGGCE
jgi:hypothetical protein